MYADPDFPRILIRSSRNRNQPVPSRPSNSLPRRDGVAIRIGFGRDQLAQGVGVRQPRLPNRGWNTERFQGLLENLAPAREVAAHDRMLGVRDGERPALIADPRAEKFGGELVFHFLDSLSVGVAKKKADHAIGKHPLHKAIDNRSDLLLAA